MDTEHISMEVLRTIVCSVLAQLYHNDFLPAELSVSVQSYSTELHELFMIPSHIAGLSCNQNKKTQYLENNVQEMANK